MKKKILIAYLCSPYIPQKSMENFLNHYKRYKPGTEHRLLICYKNLSIEQISKFRKKLKKIKHEEFLDRVKKNDFDFGTFKRVAEKYKNNLIFFMNGHSYPVIKNWLKYYYANYVSKSIIVSSASYESIFSKSFYRLHTDNYFIFFYKIIKYFFMFYPFPNPHFRTTNFLILGNDLLKYKYLENVKNKERAWAIESGKNSIYNFFKKNKFKIFLVNSENKIFSEQEWYKSETYAFKNQQKKIMSDNHVRKYSKLSKKDKEKKRLVVWGF